MIGPYDYAQNEFWACYDCGHDCSHQGIGEYYMLVDDVWMDAVDAYDSESLVRMLCIGCVEARLHRRLTVDDFKLVPLNAGTGLWAGGKSLRLRDRLTRRADGSRVDVAGGGYRVN